MKKCQAAMEFLMTYGWAILVVLVAVGALFYFGVFDKDNCNNMKISDAITLARESICADEGVLLENSATCNEYTRTIWIDLDLFEDKTGCNPACVVHTDSEDIGVNYRCTGLLPD